MDLDLDLNLNPIDLPGKPAEGEWVRELTPEDMNLIEVKLPAFKQPEIRKITLRHHALARCIALGTTDEYAARTSGYTLGNVRMLKSSPAFRDLVAHYAKSIEESFADMGTKMALIGDTALEEIQERLENKPEGFTNEQLRRLSTDIADRVGFGPQSKNTQVNVNVNIAARLEEARKRVNSAKLIEYNEAAE